MIKSKKILIIASVVFLFSVVLNGFVLAATKSTEITYPSIPGAITPTQVKALLPDYIKYAFSFAVGISALIAFCSLVYGGARWLMSAGSPQAVNDAKEQIKAGILGLATILSSVLILTTINPQLVTVNPGASVKWGITLYDGAECSGNAKEITRNTSDLGDFKNGVSLKFNYGVPAYSLDAIINKNSGNPFHSENRDCQNIGSAATSVDFIWKMPGVYLVKTDNTEKFLPASTATLGDFDDATTKIKFVDIAGSNLNFGAVLHEDPSWKGTCQVLYGYSGYVTSYDLPNTNVDTKTSSVTVFTRANSPGPGGVTLFEDDNFGGGSWSPPSDDPEKCTKIEGGNWATSVKISGNYLAVMFENDNCGVGRCEVFDSSDSNLRNNEIGRCECGPFGWGCGDCAKSIKVIPTR